MLHMQRLAKPVIYFFFYKRIKEYLNEDQKFIATGAADNNSQVAVVITHMVPCPYYNNVN